MDVISTYEATFPSNPSKSKSNPNNARRAYTPIYIYDRRNWQIDVKLEEKELESVDRIFLSPWIHLGNEIKASRCYIRKISRRPPKALDVFPSQQGRGILLSPSSQGLVRMAAANLVGRGRTLRGVESSIVDFALGTLRLACASAFSQS